MASSIPCVGTFIPYFFILILIFNGVSGDAKGILSRLYKQASQENRPLILVLDNSGAENLNGIMTPKNTDSVEINESMKDPLLDLYEILQLQKKKSGFKTLETKPSGEEGIVDRDIRRPRNRIRQQRFRQWTNKIRSDDQYNHNKYRDGQDIFVDSRDDINNDRYTQSGYKIGTNKKSFLRSPLFRSFLRYSTSLRCAARDECADECNDKFDGNKKDNCEEKCEEKYECPEPTPDPCERGECEVSDECGQDDCNVSTKGVRLVTETPKCKRC